MRNVGGRAVDLALSLLIAAWLLSLALSMIRPLLPGLVMMALGGVVVRYLIRRRGL